MSYYNTERLRWLRLLRDQIQDEVNLINKNELFINDPDNIRIFNKILSDLKLLVSRHKQKLL